MPSVLFVCTGNICRSPMAAAMFKQMVGDDWRVESAGTRAMDGMEASEEAQQEMASRGLNLSKHRARTVTGEMIHTFDLILTMEEGQKEALRAEFPLEAGKIYTLMGMSGLVGDVEDPIGGGKEDYHRTADEIAGLLQAGKGQIIKLATTQVRRREADILRKRVFRQREGF